MVSGRAPQFRGEPARAQRRRRCRRCAGLPRRGQARAPRVACGARRDDRAGGRGAEGRGRRRPAIASPRTCPTCPRRSWRCWARRASARCGRRARPISACRACSIASARSSPRVLFAVDGYWYNGKPLPILDKVAAIVERLPTVERVVVVPYLELTGQGPQDLSRIRVAGSLGCVRRRACGRADRVCAAAVRSSAVHPLFVRHHGGAEVHRPRRRRHAAAALEGASAARRPQGRATACSTSRPAAG